MIHRLKEATKEAVGLLWIKIEVAVAVGVVEEVTIAIGAVEEAVVGVAVEETGSGRFVCCLFVFIFRILGFVGGEKFVGGDWSG